MPLTIINKDWLSLNWINKGETSVSRLWDLNDSNLKTSAVIVTLQFVRPNMNEKQDETWSILKWQQLKNKASQQDGPSLMTLSLS